jgi:hypothetical protein
VSYSQPSHSATQLTPRGQAPKTDPPRPLPTTTHRATALYMRSAAYMEYAKSYITSFVS